MAETQENPSGHGKNVSTEEVAEALAYPAIFTNKILLTGLGMAVRLSFLENHLVEGELVTNCRAAVVMSLTDMLALRDLINDTEKNLQLIEVAVPPQSKPGG